MTVFSGRYQAVIRPGRPTVRTTFQFCGLLTPREGQTLTELTTNARETALIWLEGKFPATLPPQARDGKSFRCEEHGQTLHAIAIPECTLWSSRLVQPDAPFPGRDPVAGRTWTTEIAMAEDGGGVRVGVRVLCASLAYSDAPIKLTRPRVVRSLSDQFCLSDIRQVTAEPWRLKDDFDLQDLYNLLVDPKRNLPVYLLTEPDAARLGISVSRFLLDPDFLSKRLQGLGIVVTLPKDLSWAWSDMVGKVWSAFLGAVRTYRPRLDFDNDALSNHPLALPERVLAFEYDGKTAEEGFQEFLIEQAYELGASKGVDWGPCLFYADALKRDVELARNRASDDTDWKQLYEQEIEALQKQKEESDGLAESFAQDADALRKELEEAKDENRRVQICADGLRAQLEAKQGEPADTSIVIPNTYDAMPEWVSAHLAGRLLLHPRAVRSLKDAVYQDVELVYQGLLLLAREYREMRRMGNDGKSKWDDGLQKLGLRYDHSITRTRAGEQGDSYTVNYPVGSQKKEHLAFHLCKGATKDDQRCLRIYFFWDADKQIVVVGDLPRHLDTRAS